MDDRAKFANYVCKLFMNQFGSIEELIKNISKVKKLYEYFEEHVDNIYELEEEIPLFRLYYLKEHGADNFGYTNEEFEKEIKKAIRKIETQYNK